MCRSVFPSHHTTRISFLVGQHFLIALELSPGWSESKTGMMAKISYHCKSQQFSFPWAHWKKLTVVSDSYLPADTFASLFNSISAIQVGADPIWLAELISRSVGELKTVGLRRKAFNLQHTVPKLRYLNLKTVANRNDHSVAQVWSRLRMLDAFAASKNASFPLDRFTLGYCCICAGALLFAITCDQLLNSGCSQTLEAK